MPPWGYKECAMADIFIGIGLIYIACVFGYLLVRLSYGSDS